MLYLIGQGRHRQVWRRNNSNYVIKVPTCIRGIHDNYTEAETYKRSLKEDMYCRYAKCRLVGSLLIMEYAKHIGPTSDENGYIAWNDSPQWAGAVDCNQVGYNSRGQIVAYDYGY